MSNDSGDGIGDAESVLEGTIAYTLDELDAYHAYVGLGPEWRASDRRAELAALFEGRMLA